MQPAVLFLDEPTSGLDSSTSLELCSLLSDIAHNQRLTIAAIIHSPSPAAFAQFDDFLLLGKGGKVIYNGELSKAPEYFTKIGFPPPANVNPADFYMDVASGKIRRQGAKEDDVFRLDELFDAWIDHCYTRNSDSTSIIMPTIEKVVPRRNFVNSITSLFKDMGSWTKNVAMEFYESIIGFGRAILFIKDPVRDTPGFFTIYWQCLLRSFYQYFRTPSGFIGELFLHLGCGKDWVK